MAHTSTAALRSLLALITAATLSPSLLAQSSSPVLIPGSGIGTAQTQTTGTAPRPHYRSYRKRSVRATSSHSLTGQSTTSDSLLDTTGGDVHPIRSLPLPDGSYTARPAAADAVTDATPYRYSPAAPVANQAPATSAADDGSIPSMGSDIIAPAAPVTTLTTPVRRAPATPPVSSGFAVHYPQPGHDDQPTTDLPAPVNVPSAPEPPAPAAASQIQAPEAPLQASVQPSLPPQARPLADEVSEPHRVQNPPVRPFHALAVQLKVGAGGIGGDLATPLAQRLNLRVGGSFFQYTGSYLDSGVTASGTAHLRSGNLALDIFPFNNRFRISPGVTFYNGNKLHMNLAVPAGGSFDIDDGSYISSATDPVHGSAVLDFGWRAAPSLTLGTGNMIPRHNGHLSIPFEAGIQYVDRLHMALELEGSVCSTDAGNSGCGPIGSDPTAQQQLQQEQRNINNSISPLRFYPILTIGVAWAFHFGQHDSI